MSKPGKHGGSGQRSFAESAKAYEVSTYPNRPTTASRLRGDSLRICCIAPGGANDRACSNILATARALADLHDVTLLSVAGSEGVERAPVGTDGIRAKVLVPEGGAKSPLAEVARAPAAVYEWLKSQSRFDVVCTADAHGLAYYAQLARHLGLGFTNTRFAVVSVVPILWQVEQAQTLIGREIMLGRGFVEQRSLELADIQVVSCRDLRMWMARRGYQLQPEKLQEQIELPKEAPVPVREPSPVLPSVSVCLTHHNRPELIEQALSSIRAQNYEDMEVVLVDDGSTQASALAALDRLEPEFAGRGWQIVRQPNRYLGAARNTAARHARGDVLQFFDDDNVMKPEMVSTMARALICSGSDIVTSFCRQFEGNGAPGSPGARLGHEIRFVGAAESWSYLRNVVGDAACMIRREAFDAIGGFSEMQRTGKEDMELYHSAMVRRMKIEVVPEALYYYRRSSDSMKRRHTNFDAGVLRALRPHLARLPLPAAEAIRHLAAVYHRDQQRRAEDPVRSVGSWIRRRWPG